MKTYYPIVALLCALFVGSLPAQNLISSTYKGSKTQSQLIAQFGLPFIQYGAKYYKVRYTSPDAHGALDTLSGLLVVPNNNTNAFPRLVYQHGTSDCKTCVPSRYGSAGGGEGDAGLVMAGMGFIALLPDYVGMGDGRGFQAYVHAATEATAAMDFIRASGDWLTQNGFYANNQLFITGYSQGGHASMALHRAIETQWSIEITVTAAAHLSGPYSISGVMRDLILNANEYFYPAYIPNSILSYQNVYGNIYGDLAEIFKPAFIPAIEQYYAGIMTLSALNASIISTLVAQNGASIPRQMLQDNLITAMENDNNHPLNMAMRDNDLFHWAPAAPTRIFYCMGDDQVPYLNSVIARDTMLALGAANLAASDVNPNASHTECVEPALTATLVFFLGFQQIYLNTEPAPTALPFTANPNPASDWLQLAELPLGSSCNVVDIQGKIVFSQSDLKAETLEIPVQNWQNGIYVVRVIQENGAYGMKRVVVYR